MSRLGVRGGLWLSLAVVLLSNVVVLAGVYYNRSGVPQSVLTLSERELSLSSGQWLNREADSALHLQLLWRHEGDGGATTWLTASRLQAMGFTVPVAADPDGQQRFRRQLERSVWLVLELNGPAYRRQVQQARQALDEAEARVRSRPDDGELLRQRDHCRERLEEEVHHASRLFLVDAGLDADALRVRYPDRQGYVLLAGHLKPYYATDRGFSASVQTGVSGVSVPHAWREVFDGWNRDTQYREKKPRVTVEVAFGQRHEPWMVEAAR